MMVRRSNHYEAAFEDYLRSRGWPYIPVDEQKKAIFSGARIKSFDFIVYRPGDRAWLVDIKGRKLPAVGKGSIQHLENWVTRDDLEGLQQWEGVFGKAFEPVFVFVYWVVGSAREQPPTEAHPFRGEYYVLMWVSALQYRTYARLRSPKWDTLSVPSSTFRKLIRPLCDA